jgi:hypothetical protein
MFYKLAYNSKLSSYVNAHSLITTVGPGQPEVIEIQFWPIGAATYKNITSVDRLTLFLYQCNVKIFGGELGILVIHIITTSANLVLVRSTFNALMFNVQCIVGSVFSSEPLLVLFLSS